MSAPIAAAACSVPISPRAGLPLGGYAVTSSRVASGSLDSLEANVLHLRDAEGQDVVWVSIDSLAIHPRLHALVAENMAESRGVAPEAVLLTASHTHAAPSPWHGPIHPVLPAELDEIECRRLAVSIGIGAADAVAPLRPARLGWGRAPVLGVGGNRHDAEGPHSPDAGVLYVRNEALDPLAVLFDYACHPTVLSPDNTFYSSDWVGAARSEIRREFGTAGSALPVIFLQGSAGDVSARFNRRGRNAAEVHRLGAIVARAVVDASHADQPLTGTAIVRMRSPISGRVRRDFLDASLPADPTSSSSDRLEQSRSEGIAAIRALAEARLPSIRESHATLVRVGERSWLHHPFELTTALEAAVVGADPELRVVGYTDDYVGYLAEPESHARNDYEALASFFDSEETVKLVRQLAEAGRA